MQPLHAASPPGFIVPDLPLVGPQDCLPAQRELAARIVAAIARGACPEDVVLDGVPPITDPLELDEAVAHADHLAAVLKPPAAPVRRRPRVLALNRTDAADALGVSADFFDEHVAHELRCVRRGRRRLYAVSELERWLDEEGERPGPRQSRDW